MVFVAYKGLVSKYFKRVWRTISRVGYFEERALKWAVLIKKGLGAFKKGGVARFYSTCQIS